MNNLLFRPLWFLSYKLDIIIINIFGLLLDTYIISKIHNLILYLLFALTLSFIVFKTLRNIYLTILIYALILFSPNNFHTLIWVACRSDIQFGLVGLLSLSSFLYYKKNSNYFYLLFSVSFFSIALLFKESAIAIPFVIIVVYYSFFSNLELIKLKNYIFHLLLLVIYILYKLLFLKDYTDNILNYYSFTYLDRVNVIPKAFISFFSSFDYLTIFNLAYNISFADVIIILSSIILLNIIIIVYRKKPKRLFLLFFLFLISISPNILAGYFRPQLIFVPFAFTLILVSQEISLLSEKSTKFIRISLTILILLFSITSYTLINDYKNAYFVLKRSIDVITNEVPQNESKNIFLFIPSRLKQTYILDNIPATYNYFKYSDFVHYDTVQGFVNYAALDIESLNSEIIISIINDSTITARCTGKTQYFYNIYNNSALDYENDFIKCEFLFDEMFLNKCKVVKIVLKDKVRYNYIALTNNLNINMSRL